MAEGGGEVHGSCCNGPEVFPSVFSDRSELYYIQRSLWDEGKEFISIPILNLSHITHDEEAKSIMENQEYIFIPAKKMGKVLGKYDGSPVGETFRKIKPDQYQHIPRDGPSAVFPGYLSWWGVSTETWYETDPRGKKVKKIMQDLKDKGIEVPGYLQSPVSNNYGNHAFVSSFNNLLNCYKESRDDYKIKSIYLKKAGTLRYKHEICYVIMVCIEGDLDREDELKDMPGMHGDSIFEHRGYINKEGKLVDAVPHFNLKHAIRQQNFKCYPWESLAFAFYFPRREQCLRCPGSVIVHAEVSHTFCTSTKPQGRNWVCPNTVEDN